MKALILFFALSATCFAQPYAQSQTAYVWQLTPVPGNYYAVPRYTFVGDWLFGPRVIFVPQSQPYSGPVQPQSIPGPVR